MAVWNSPDKSGFVSCDWLSGYLFPFGISFIEGVHVYKFIFIKSKEQE